uniref:G-protein coupled receptors family 1 profile domain-containing protein n=1 Tax=Globodera rostochiensis TaxID=31243 RepID=A0A914IGG5_GLORO
MSNSSSDQPPPPLTYLDLFRQNGGHTAAMWLIISEKCALSLVGILFNAILVVATVKAKKLRSICNLLIAMDSAFLGLYQLNALITFLIALFGINFVTISTCFYIQVVPMFAVLMSFCVVFQMGLERLANVLFPIWSIKDNSKRFHAAFLLVSLCSTCYLIWLQHDDSHCVNKMVMCTASDVPALVGNENFSKSILRSLLFLVVLEMVGWFPILYLNIVIQTFQLSPVTATYLSAAFTTISSCITASANAPSLYYFSDLYRDAINAIFVGVGIKKANKPKSVVVVVTRNGNWINRE